MTDTLPEVSPLVQNSVLMAAVKWGRGNGAQYFSGTAGPQMARCLERLVGILKPDDQEMQDRRYFEDATLFVEDIGSIADRYVNVTGKQGRTARNYSLKAARLVTEYMRFAEGPSTYKPLKEFKRKRRSRTTLAEPSANAGVPRQPLVSVPLSAVSVDVPTALRDFPLGNGRRFMFELPDPYGLTEEDGERIIAHLKTFITDQPTVPPEEREPEDDDGEDEGGTSMNEAA